MFQLLVAKGALLDEKDENGDQPIHAAAKSGSIEIVDFLQEKGVFVCSAGAFKNTIMHYASKFGRYELVKKMVDKGCPCTLENALKETPLHLAAGFYTRGLFPFLLVYT